jgi:Tol biopolymer transport system component
VVDFNPRTGRPSRPRCLTCDQPGPNGLAKWSPDDRKILFHSQRTRNPGGPNAGGGFPFDDVWIMNADGSNPTPLTFGTGDSADFHAVWSPDGKRIAWIHHGCIVDCFWELMIADYVDEPVPHLANPRRLSPEGDPSFWETQDFTPDGLLMVTITAEGLLNGESFLVDPDTGERVRRLTHNPYWDEQFHPSPDGRTIIQMSARDNPGAAGAAQLAAYEAGTPPTNDYRLIPIVASVFGSGDGPRTDLYLIDAVRGDARIQRLTFLGDAGQVIPEFGWSPDGRFVAWGGRRPIGDRKAEFLGLQILSFAAPCDTRGVGTSHASAHGGSVPSCRGRPRVPRR